MDRPYICDRSQTQSKLAMFLISFFVGTLAVDRFVSDYCNDADNR